MAKVAKIAKECRRVNQKYRDPHFDLEFDLGTNTRDCLQSLSNIPEDYFESDCDDNYSDDSRSGSGSRRRRRRVRRRTPSPGRRPHPRLPFDSGAPGGDGGPPPRDALEGGDRRVPGDRDANGPFRPQSVKRVGEIFDDPKFYIEGPTAHDVRQGRDSDCWLLSALCTLGNKPGLIERVCVARDEAVGVYGFVFHRDGEWFSEIIDDKVRQYYSAGVDVSVLRLVRSFRCGRMHADIACFQLYLTKPDYDEVNMLRVLWEDRDRINSEETYRKTYQSNSGALYFASCDNPNETWLPLLEKAYAKAHGDYAAIEGGLNGEGIEDLTGGVSSEIFATDILDKVRIGCTSS